MYCLPIKSKIELSDDSPAAKVAGLLNLALDKVRVKHKINHNKIITTLDFNKGNVSITLLGINPRDLIFTRSDARILRECVIRVIKKPAYFESLVVNNKKLTIIFKF